jgi:peptidoglycan/LPS O-acetylase OafA/YrhL
MKPLPLAGLVAAASLSTLIVLDIIWNASNPDQPGPWVDAEGSPALARFLSGVHVALYALLAAGLIRYGRVIDGGRRFVTVIRWIIAAGYAVFAVLFAWLMINSTMSVDGVYATLSTVAFAATLLVPIVLGFGLIRRREFRVPSILLIAPLVVFPLVLLLEAFTDWAHPGYLETVVNFGVALLCVAASASPPADERRSTDTAIPSTEAAAA